VVGLENSPLIWQDEMVKVSSFPKSSISLPASFKPFKTSSFEQELGTQTP